MNILSVILKKLMIINTQDKIKLENINDKNIEGYTSYFFAKNGMEIKVVNNTFQSKTDAFNAIWESEEAWKGYVIRGRNSTNNLNNCVGIILCYEEGDYPIIIDFSTYIAKIRYGNELNNCIFVRAIQQYLVWLGYDIGKSGIDGKYGYNTYKAVIRFQRDNRINENGIVGIETYFNLSKGRSCKKK